MIMMHISKPCHENWSSMSPVQQGRHCQQCNTVVMDMTSLTNEEILAQLKSGVKCGVFLESQLELPVAGKGLLSQVLVTIRKDWALASMLFMLQLTPSSMYAKTIATEQLHHIPNLFPIDSGVGLPGYVQGRVSSKDKNIPAANKKVQLRSASGKKIDTTTTDSNGFFAFVLPENHTENYYIVFEHYKKKTRSNIYHWRKTKVLCKSGTWTELKVKRIKRRKLSKYFQRRVMGCPKFR